MYTNWIVAAGALVVGVVVWVVGWHCRLEQRCAQAATRVEVLERFLRQQGFTVGSAPAGPPEESPSPAPAPAELRGPFRAFGEDSYEYAVETARKAS